MVCMDLRMVQESHMTVQGRITDNRFIQCKLDPAFFYLLTKNGLSGII